MPRKAPAEVVEHRITLGNYERDQLKQLVSAKETQLYLSPFSPLMPMVALGGAGYAALAYALDWWPFDGPSSWSGLAWLDKTMQGVFTDEAKAAEKEQAELDAHDKAVVFAEKWLREHPSPDSMWTRLQHKQFTKYVADADDTRQGIIDKWVRWRAYAAEKAAEIEKKSDHV